MFSCVLLLEYQGRPATNRVKEGSEKMWLKAIHTEKFVHKIAGEFGYSPLEIKNKVNSFYNNTWLYYQVINYLRCLTADEMRFIFKLNKY